MTEHDVALHEILNADRENFRQMVMPGALLCLAALDELAAEFARSEWNEASHAVTAAAFGIRKTLSEYGVEL